MGFGTALRGIITGVNAQDATAIDGQYTNVDGASDNAGDPGGAIETAIPWAVGIPYADVQYDDPGAIEWGGFQSNNPTLPQPDQGALPGVGAYDGRYSEIGAVQGFGHEMSGGPYGNQALGRRQTFIPYIPERYDANGVQTESYADLVAAAVASQGYPTPDESYFVPDLLTNL